MAKTRITANIPRNSGTKRNVVSGAASAEVVQQQYTKKALQLLGYVQLENGTLMPELSAKTDKYDVVDKHFIAQELGFNSVRNAQAVLSDQLGIVSAEDLPEYKKENPNLYAVMGPMKYKGAPHANPTVLTDEELEIVNQAIEADKFYRRTGQNVSAQYMNFDFEGQQEEIDDFEAKKKSASELKFQRDKRYNIVYNGYIRAGYGKTKAKEMALKDVEQYDAQLAKYGDINELQNQITSKKSTKKSAERTQALIDMTSVIDPDSQNYDADFEKWSAKGANIENSNFWGNIDSGKATNPVMATRAQYGNYFASGGANGQATQYGAGALRDDLARYLAMTEQQVKIYNYYLAKEKAGLVEKGTSDEYIELLEHELNKKLGEEVSEFYYDKPFLQYSYGIKAGTEQFSEGVKNFFNATDDYIAPSVTQVASSNVREDISDRDGWVGTIGYDLINTTANMMPSILVSTALNIIAPGAGTVAGATLMGVSSAGGAYQEALNSGFDKTQARVYSTLVGASEALLSYAFSGISKLGGKLTNSVISKAIQGIDKGFAKFAIEYGGKALSEGFEEGLQEILDPIFKSLATNTDVEYWGGIDWGAVAYSALLGALSAGILEGVPGTVSTIGKNATIKAKYGNSIQQQIEIGLNMSKESQAYKLATKYQDIVKSGKNLSTTQLGMLVEANNQQMKANDTTKIAAAAELRLIELGERTNTTEIALVITKQLIGEKTTSAENNVLKNSKYGQRVLNEANPQNVVPGEYASEWARNIGTEWINKNIYNIADNTQMGTLQSTANDISQPTQAKQNPILQSTANGGIINQNTSGGAGNDGEQGLLRNGGQWSGSEGSNTQIPSGTLPQAASGISGTAQEGYQGLSEQSSLRNSGNNRGLNLTAEQSERLKDTVIVDDDGTPKAVYHFTENMDFDTFGEGDIGFHFGSIAQAQKRGVNLKQTGRIIIAHLAIKNPVRIPVDIMSWQPSQTALKLWDEGIVTHEQYLFIHNLQTHSGYGYNSSAAVELRRILAEKGYDGIVYENHFEGDGESYIAFYPEQVIIIDDGKGNTQATSQNEAASFMPENEAQSDFGGEAQTDTANSENTSQTPQERNLQAIINATTGKSTTNADKAKRLKKEIRRYDPKTDGQKEAKRVADELGLEVVFEDTVETRGSYKNGYIDENNVIHIDFREQQPAKFVLVHELTHYCEETGQYGKFTKALKKSKLYKQWLRETTKMPNAKVEVMEARYRNAVIEQRGWENTEDAVSRADREMVADFCGTKLFGVKDTTDMQALLDGLTNTERRTVLEVLSAFIKRIGATLSRNTEAIQSLDLVKLERLYSQMYNEAKNNPTENGEVRDSIDPNFSKQYDKWDKKTIGAQFRVGTTSKVLQNLGVDTKTIYWDTSKIKKIQEKHPDMTDEVIKQVPNILENPIIVMESVTVKGRLTLFGEVYDASGAPVLAILELNPTDKNGHTLDIFKIASAYGKSSNPQGLINKSKILYIDQNKERTNSWLTANGLQLPRPSSSIGSTNSILKNKSTVNNNFTQNNKNYSENNKDSITVEFDDVDNTDSEDYNYDSHYGENLRDTLQHLKPSTDREWQVFCRSFANKTNGMKKGEYRNIDIFTEKHLYLVEADGYMSGVIYSKINIDNYESRGYIYDNIRNADDSDRLYEIIGNRQGNNGDSSSSSGEETPATRISEMVSFIESHPEWFGNKRENYRDYKRRVEAERKASAFSMPENEAQDGFELTEFDIREEKVDWVQSIGDEVAKYDRKTADQRALLKAAQKLGWKVGFANVYKRDENNRPIRDENGNYQRANARVNKSAKEIVFDYNCQTPIRELIKHELTHFLETNVAAYQDFANAVMNSKAFKAWIRANGYESTTDYNLAIRQTYNGAKGFENESDAENSANLEMVANFVAANLFSNEQAMLDRLVAELNPAQRSKLNEIVHKLFTALKNAFAGMTQEGEIQKLENRWIDTYKKAETAWQEKQEAGNQIDKSKSVNSKTNNSNEYSFALEKDTSLIAEAELMEQKGANRDEIWEELRIIRDIDGAWVYEIDDSEMKFYPEGDALIKDDPDYKEFKRLDRLDKMTKKQIERCADLEDRFMLQYGYGPWLKNYLVHDKLYAKFPHLKETVLQVVPDSKDYLGYYDTKTNTIAITENVMYGDKIELNKTVIHEIQHALQTFEDRENGANVEFWNARILSGKAPTHPITGEKLNAEDAYRYTAGEIEAREASERYELYDEWRELVTPDFGWDYAIRAGKLPAAVSKEYINAVENGNIEEAQQIVDTVARATGYTERLYHQTNADFTEFNTDNQRAGKYDWELPTGTFLKPTDADIGLSGKKQMELYANIRNPLVFANRYAAQKFWSENINGYAEAAQAVKDIDVKYRMKTDRAINAVQAYMKQWRKNNPNASRMDIYSEPEFQRLHDAENRMIEEWGKKSDEASLIAKKLIDDFIASNDYDGIIIERDQGSFGRVTKTYVVFDSSQLKDASPVTRDDNGNVIALSERFNKGKRDIRYSRPIQSSVDNYTEEQYNNFGWVTDNKIVSPKEREILFSRYADYKHNGDKYPITRFGETVIHSTECPDVIMYVKGTIRSPKVIKVVRIKHKESWAIPFIKEEILSNEYKQDLQPFKTVEDYFGQGVLDISKARDYESFREVKTRTERERSQGGNTNSGT